MEWYQKSAEAVEQELKTNRETGLVSTDVPKRLESYGLNKLEEAKRVPLGTKLLNQIKDPLVLILIAAAVLSALTDSAIEALIIIAIVILNAILSIYQEGKAEDSVAALQKMSSPQCQGTARRKARQRQGRRAGARGCGIAGNRRYCAGRLASV